MSRQRKREMVNRQHPALPMGRQSALLGISRSSMYYRPRGTSPENLAVMKAIDQQYLVTPFYGSRRITVWLGRPGYSLSRKRVQRLMRTMGLTSIYRRPRTSRDGARAQGVSLSVSLAVLNFSKVAVENVPPCEIGPVPFSFSPGRRGWGDEQGGSYCVTPLLERRATQNVC